MNLTERIESVILSNYSPTDERKIGVEIECIIYNEKMQRIPVDPCEEYSAADLLNELEALQKKDLTKAGYSLEPGGQLEWASSPFVSLVEIEKQYKTHLKRLIRIAKRENLIIIDYALEPTYSPLDIKLIDNKKYYLMDKMFQRTGKLGQWMMRNSASVQINIDFSSQQDAERMAFISDCISPLTSILFANSPFKNGESANWRNLRYEVWNDTDAWRSGDLLTHGITTQDNLLSKYANYVQRVPAIFYTDSDKNIKEYDGSLGQWLKNLEDENLLTDYHIQIALHQIFTHVRFKTVLEVRGNDRPPFGYELAPAAFWTGLLLDDETQLKAFDIVKHWDLEERKQLIALAGKLDVKQIGPQNKSIADWINIICELSLSGLLARSNNNKLKSESNLLENYLNLYNDNGIISLKEQKNYKKRGKSVKKFIEKEKLNSFYSL